MYIQKFAITLIIVMHIVITAGCTTGKLSFKERMMNEAKCIPPLHPTKELFNPIEEDYLLSNKGEPFRDVTDFYLDLLSPVSAKDSLLYNTNGLWRVQNLPEPESGKLFDCYNMIDSFTEETGCIFLHNKSENETVIEYRWYLSEISSGCSSLVRK